MANVGGIERALRVVGGAALVGLTLAGPWKDVLYPWGFIGVVPLLTGLIGWCPAYALFGIKTCKSCGSQ